ncbi:MAG: FtsX-like permease family protein [Flavobacteriales bacterium]|nr:FtsX-like permease family protein [Flavobacteriales bacterium]
MLLKIAWRNIWRNSTRSVVVIIAIALGLWAGVFASAFVQGLMKQKIESVISMEMSDFQFHELGFNDEYLAKLYMENGEAIRSNVATESDVIGSSGRLISMGMIGSAKQNGAIKIIGIEPNDENAVTGLGGRVLEGEYFEGMKRNPVLISKRTAKKFKVKLRSKIVLTLQDVDGEIIAGAFRVVGIYSSENGIFDDTHLYVRQSDLRNMMKIDKGLHEIAVLLNDHDLADQMAIKYQEQHEDLEVKSWLDLTTGMRMMVDMIDMYLYYIVGIILVALLFSILNTMLMAVLERVREIGMLMAVGMTKGKVFMMIMLETVILSTIGGPLGLLISWAFVAHFGANGIDLGGAYDEYGFSSIVYPYLDGESYLNVAYMVVIMAIIAAIYPAIKALKLKPVEAIRKI